MNDWYLSGSVERGHDTLRIQMNTPRGGVVVGFDSKGVGDPAGWYWTHGKRENQQLRAQIEFTSPEVDASPYEYQLTSVADECLNWAGLPELNLEAPDGIVLEAPGLMLAPFGDKLLLHGRDHRLLIDSGAGQPPSLSPAEIPPGERPSRSQMHVHDCGNGDLVLSFRQGWAFGADQTAPPTTRSWRRSGGRWEKQKDTDYGFVVGCGADWTLYLASPHEYRLNMSDVPWSFQLEGTSGLTAPQLRAGTVGEAGRCPHRLVVHDARAFPSGGEVIAAGTVCRPKGSGHPAIESWTLGQIRSQFHQPAWLPGAFHVAITGQSPDDVRIFALGDLPDPAGSLGEGRQHEIVLRRSGGGWSPLEGSSAREALFAGWDGRNVWRRGPGTTNWQSAPIPRVRHPRVAHQSILYHEVAPSGDVWLVAGYNENDCGGCFQYTALLRVPSESFKTTAARFPGSD